MRISTVDAIRRFNRYYTGVIGLTNECILQSPYSLAEVRVLYEVFHTPGVSAGAIKETMQVDEGYISRVIARLVRQKLIDKKKSRSDRRVSALTLSAKGEAVFLKLNQRSAEAINGVISHLSKQQQQDLVDHFQQIENLLTNKVI